MKSALAVKVGEFGARSSPSKGATAPGFVQSAKAAGLRYVTDDTPGYSRRRNGSGSIYSTPDGSVIRDAGEIRRIKLLAIPPAWRDVWICPSAYGHLQASGRDAKGRKQHLYHRRWREVRDETKYGRMLQFGERLPEIRRRVERDLALPGLPRAKILAAVVRLLDVSMIRVGNEEYAKLNGSYGLATMRDRHVSVSGARIQFQFRGKSGVRHAVDLNDRRLARIIKKCQDLPGQELFKYVDADGAGSTIGSGDVNEYLRNVAGEDFSSKDFRTWAGTVLAAGMLAELRTKPGARLKADIGRVIESVAKKLGNTKTVCRKSYIHPVVIQSFDDGSLGRIAQLRMKNTRGGSRGALRPEETAVLMLLRLGARRRPRRAARGITLGPQLRNSRSRKVRWRR